VLKRRFTKWSSGLLVAAVLVNPFSSLTFHEGNAVHAAEAESIVDSDTVTAALQEQQKWEVLPLLPSGIKFLPEADTFVWSDPAQQDLNQNGMLYNQVHMIGNGPNDTRIPYLRFNLASLPAIEDDAVIRLRLFTPEANTTVPIQAHAVEDNAWGESTITWNNRPPIGAEIATLVLGPAGASGDTFEVDITDYIKQKKAAGETKASLALVNNTSSWRAFINRERTWESTRQPYLVYYIDKEGPAYKSAEVSGDYKKVTLTFDEALTNNTSDALISQVMLDTGSTGFVGLTDSDTVTIEGKQLIIALDKPLTGEKNRIKVLGNALKDASGNVTAADVVTTPLQGQPDTVNPPSLVSVGVEGTAKALRINFDRPIAWQAMDYKGNIQLSLDGGNSYSSLGEQDSAAIVGKSIKVSLKERLEGATAKVKILADTVKSLGSDLPYTSLIDETLNVPAPLTAQSTIKVAEDTYVDAGGARNPSDVSADSPFYKNYGNEKTFYTREVAGPSVIGAAKARGFLKFNVADLGAFNTAKLRVFLLFGNGDGGTIKFYAVDDNSWTENGLTFENQPVYGKLIGTAVIGGNKDNTWYEVDITDYLSEKKAEGGIVSIMMMDDENSTAGARSYLTKERTGATSYPQLVVNYDAQSPEISGTSVLNANKTVEVTFKEPLFNNTADLTELKNQVATSTDGVNYTALKANDTVSISGKKLIINFSDRLTAARLNLKIGAFAIRDAFENANATSIISNAIVVDVAAPVLEQQATLDPDNKVIRIQANEALQNSAGDLAALKAAVTISKNGQSFESLGSEDQVAVSGQSLVITLFGKLTGTSNSIKIAASALSDVNGNRAAAFTSNEFAADASAPQLESAFFVNFNRMIKLVFNEQVYNNEADLQQLKGKIKLSRDGGRTYSSLGSDDRIEIGINHLNIVPETALKNAESIMVSVDAGALKDALGHETDDINTNKFAAADVSYPYAEPSEHYLQDALKDVNNMKFSNLDNAQGSSSELQAAKGLSVIAQAIASGNHDQTLVNEYVSAVRKILTVPGSMPNLQAGLDDRVHSAVVYAIALLWNDETIMTNFTPEEKSKLVTFMKAALISVVYSLSDYDYTGAYIGYKARRMAMNGDGNNGTTGNYGEPHLTTLFASSFALGTENVKDIVRNYDHKAFITELNNQGLTTIAASFSSVTNFSTKSTQAERSAEKASKVEAVVRNSNWSFMDVSLDEYLENPLVLFAKQEAYNWPHKAEDGQYQGELGMGFEFQSEDSGGPRESAGYVILGLEPSIANTVLLHYFGYLNMPGNEELAKHILKLQKVASSDYYEKTINGYFGQSWPETKTYTNSTTWPYLMELLFSTGNVTATAFNETFNYSNTTDMKANGWVFDPTKAKVPNDTIIPYNYKKVVNTGVVDGINADPNEKLLILDGTTTPQIAYNSKKKLGNINYAAWIGTRALGNGEAGILARMVDENNYYQISFTKDKLFIKKKVNGQFTTIAEKAYTLPVIAPDYVFSFDPWGWQETISEVNAHRLRVELTNETINVYVNGNKELSATDSQFADGYVGVTAIGANVKFDALLVTNTLAAAPTLNAVKVGNESLTLDYTPIDGALRYVVKYGTTSGQYTHTYATTSTAPVITNLSNDTTYYFTVSSINTLGESTNSNEVSGTPRKPSAVTPVLQSLTADGSTVTVNFTEDPKNTSYIIKAGTSSGNYTYEFDKVSGTGYPITLPLTSLPYYVVIIPYNENGEGEASNELSVLLDVPFIRINDVTASESPDILYPPFNTIDGILTAESRWSAEKEQWIQYDMGSMQEINAVSIAYASGDKRQAYFDIAVSDDGIIWTNVFADGKSSGATIDLETYSFNAVTTRYVRIICHGNSSSGYGLGWNSIIETRIFQAAPTKPTNLQVESKTSNSIRLKWNASSNQSGTLIYYDVYQGATKLNATDIAGTTYTVTGLTPDTSYTFHIVAKDANGKTSVPGAPLTVRTDVAAGSIPGSDPRPVTTPTPTFQDLASVPWAKQAIEVLASKGIINGTSSATFEPQANITRADFLKLLIGALGLQAEAEENFEDVSRSDYYYEAAGIAKKLGISSGVGNNKLNPKASITREDMMVMVERALKAAGKELGGNQANSLSKFKDAAQVAGYAQDSIAALVQTGLIVGNANHINPKGSTTRAEAAVLLYRIYNFN
jgi:Uncharacterized protein contain chitin-binding domain type 3